MKLNIDIDTNDLSNAEFENLIALLKASRPLADVEVEEADTAGVELEDEEIDNLLENMRDFALGGEINRIFKTPELYRLATDQNWGDLHPNSRKAIGRRFKKIVDAHFDEAELGEAVIQYHGRNLQNTALYRLIEKTEDR